MALNAGTVWEIRTTGAQTNGGGFYDRDPGTSVDYSQQDAAQLALTDIATDGAGTGISSVTGGFTAAMVGNIIFLTGGGANEGWYEITAVADTNTATIDRSAGLNKSSVTGNVGGAWLLGGTLDNNFFTTTQKATGNTVYIKSGTYTLGEAATLRSGAPQLPVKYIGYNIIRGDSPLSTNRPVIDCNTLTLTFGERGVHKNIIFTGTATRVIDGQSASSSWFHNCKYTNTSGTANRHAIQNAGGDSIYSNCEFVSTNGVAINTLSQRAKFIHCYVHDSVRGLAIRNGYMTVIGCIVSSCSTTGIEWSSSGTIYGSTIYNCGTGILSITEESSIFVNNIITECTVGYQQNAGTYTNFLGNNCWNNTTDVVNISKGDTDITADPLLTDPANGDFTLSTGSPCFNTGMTLGASVGL